MNVELIYNDGYFNTEDVVTPTGKWRILQGINRENGATYSYLQLECFNGFEKEKVYEPTFFSKYLKIGKGDMIYKKTSVKKKEYIHESHLLLRFSNECGE